jgi:glutamate synthase (NADPH/NADH) small chain
MTAVKTDDRKQPIPGSDFTIETDLVLIAIGQSKLGQLLSALEGVRLEGGRVVTDEHGYLGRPGWYAGGDCRNGGKEVVNAAAEGKTAARAIHRYVMGGSHA